MRKNETLAQVFFLEFCEIFKNTFLIEHLQWLLLLRPVLRKTDILFFDLWRCSFIKLKAKRDAMNLLFNKLFNKGSDSKLYGILYFCFWLFITFCKVWIKKHFFKSTWIVSTDGKRVILANCRKLCQMSALTTTSSGNNNISTLSPNPTKWWNVLKLFKLLPTNYLSVFGYFEELALTWLNRVLSF